MSWKMNKDSEEEFLDLKPPPIAEDLHKKLEGYMLEPGRLSIHSSPRSQIYCNREPDFASLMEKVDYIRPDKELEVVRDLTTGEIIKKNTAKDDAKDDEIEIDLEGKEMSMDFAEKVVLVTGASAGIGEATAVLLASRGAQLALVGRSEEGLKAAGKRCAEISHGRKPLLLPADLATDEGCERVARETLKHYDRLDVLVNNAAVGCRATIQSGDMATFDRVFATNIRGVYNLTRLLVPALVHAKGNIVNVSSIQGSMVTTGCLPYSMAKAALDHFSCLIAYELAPKGVRVNVVSPGLTESTFTQRVTGYTDEEYKAWLRKAERMIPLGRACSPEECARVIAALACERSGVITGAVVPVDGGLRFVGAGANSDALRDQLPH